MGCFDASIYRAFRKSGDNFGKLHLGLWAEKTLYEKLNQNSGFIVELSVWFFIKIYILILGRLQINGCE